jgi:hypothetical protein
MGAACAYVGARSQAASSRNAAAAGCQAPMDQA